MGLFSNIFGKEKEKVPVVQNGKVNLKSLLSEEEVRLLVTDLGLIENKVDPQSRNIVIAAKELAEEKGTVALPVLDLYIAAVQSAVDMFSAFNMVPGGTTALLEKLKSAKSENSNTGAAHKFLVSTRR